MEELRNRLHQQIAHLTRSLTEWLTQQDLSPNQVTVCGLVLCLLAAALIALDFLVFAGFVWLIGGVLDLLDGALAREQNRVSRSGAFLDSTLDRISDGVVLAAIVYHFASHGDAVTALLAALALLGSVLVSYTRARAEALGAGCEVGAMTRPERVVVLTLGLWLGLLQVAVYVLVAMTAVTVGQRMQHTLRQLSA